MNAQERRWANLGVFDPVSHEWTDGILAIQYRNAAQSKVGKPEDRKWVLLEPGPSAIWMRHEHGPG